MSISGFNIYHNDSLSDLIDHVQDGGIDTIVNAFEAMMLIEERATLAQCETALAATEIVASLNGDSSEQVTEDHQEKIDQIKREINFPVTSKLREVAADVIDLLGADSELKDLWKDSEHFENWNQHLMEIQNRLLN